MAGVNSTSDGAAEGKELEVFKTRMYGLVSVTGIISSCINQLDLLVCSNFEKRALKATLDRPRHESLDEEEA